MSRHGQLTIHGAIRFAWRCAAVAVALWLTQHARAQGLSHDAAPLAVHVPRPILKLTDTGGLVNDTMTQRPHDHASIRGAGPDVTSIPANAQESGSDADSIERRFLIQPATDEPFAQGSFSFSSHTSASFSTNDGSMVRQDMAAGFYFFHGHAVTLNLHAGHLNGIDGVDDGTIGGFDIIFRSHWVRFENWSIFIDGGAGIVWTEDTFPTGGTAYNFVPQVGAGVTIELCDHTHLIMGARWHHISNANIKGSERNPGYNGILIYFGLLLNY